MSPKKMSSRPIISIAYSTLADRVANIKFPAPNPDQEILVLVQNEDDNSYVLGSTTAKLIELKSRGVAKSRNAAIDRASGKYLMFADDDITLNESGIESAIRYLEENPDCDIILAQAMDESGVLRKKYFPAITSLRLTNSARAATYEMIIRLDAVRKSGLRFDENFGAGAKFYLGDEYIFIADALRAGLKGIHFPTVIAVHPKESSGSRWGTEVDLSARSQVFARVFGWRAPIYRLAFILRGNNPFPGLRKAIRFVVNR